MSVSGLKLGVSPLAAFRFDQSRGKDVVSSLLPPRHLHGMLLEDSDSQRRLEWGQEIRGHVSSLWRKDRNQHRQGERPAPRFVAFLPWWVCNWALFRFSGRIARDDASTGGDGHDQVSIL